VLGSIHAWSLDERMADDASVEAVAGSVKHACGSALHLTQALASASLADLPRLIFVTRGAQAVVEGEHVEAVQATVSTLGLVVTLEHPELRCVCLDLDPKGEPSEVSRICDALEIEQTDNQLAFRARTLHTR